MFYTDHNKIDNFFSQGFEGPSSVSEHTNRGRPGSKKTCRICLDYCSGITSVLSRFHFSISIFLLNPCKAKQFMVKGFIILRSFFSLFLHRNVQSHPLVLGLEYLLMNHRTC